MANYDLISKINSDTFFSDIHFEDTYCAKIVRSPIACGFIKVILPQFPQDYIFFSASDTEKNEIVIDGISIPFFTKDKVSYKGEPLGIIIGPKISIIEELLSNITFETSEIEPVLFSESFSEEQVLLKKVFLQGNCDTIISQSGNIIERKLQPSLQLFPIKEPMGVITEILNGKIHIFASENIGEQILNSLAGLLETDRSNIVYHKTKSPLFKIDNDINFILLVIQTAVSSWYLKKNLKIVFQNDELSLISRTAVPSITQRISVNKEKETIDAYYICILIDAGFYSPFLKTYAEELIFNILGEYDFKSYRIELFALKTNNSPANYVHPDFSASFSLETLLYDTIKTFALDVYSFRKNFLSDDSRIDFFPEATLSNKIACFDAACKNSDFYRKYISFSDVIKKRKSDFETPLKSIGIASCIKGTSLLKNLSENTSIVFPYEKSCNGSITVEIEIDPFIYEAEIKNIFIVVEKSHLQKENLLILEIKRNVAFVLDSLIEGKRFDVPFLNIDFIETEKDVSNSTDIVFQGLPVAFFNAISLISKDYLTSFPLKSDTLYKILCKPENES